MTAMARVGLSHAAVYGATGVQTLVTPGANTNGLILRTAWVLNTSGSQLTALFVGATAPADATSTTVPSILVGGPGGNVIGREIFVPAGQGIYAASTAVGNCFAHVTYDLIP